MYDFSLGLSYQEDIPEEYFADFIAAVRETGTDLQTEAREPVPYAALEWLVPTAIAIYIGKPFVDAIVNRAADDFGDAVYPKVKSAIQNFLKRVFVRQPLPIKIIATAEHKVQHVEAMVFSIHAPAVGGKQFKFIFSERLNEEDCVIYIDALFAQLAEHHSSDTNDVLTEQIAQLENQRFRVICVLYNPTLCIWSVVDPMARGRQIHAEQKDK
jgi:hypothetical protein